MKLRMCWGRNLWGLWEYKRLQKRRERHLTQKCRGSIHELKGKEQRDIP